MAAVGSFDELLQVKAWFDGEGTIEGWFDLDLTPGAAAGGSPQTLTQSATTTNAQTFYAPTVAAGTVTLTPSLYTNGATFYAATVAAGAVTLSPPRLDGAQTFYSPTVSAGAATLTPGLYSNAQTFYSPTVAAGAVTLAPARLNGAQTFYTPTVTAGAVTLTQSARFDGAQTFYTATVTAGDVILAQGSRVDNAQTFYPPTVTVPQTIAPALFTNANTIYVPRVQNQYPDPSTVQIGVQYGSASAPLTGTLVSGFNGALKLDVSTGRLVKIITNKIALSL